MSDEIEDRPATMGELAAEVRHLQDRLIAANLLIRASRFDADNRINVNRDAYRAGKRHWIQEITAPLKVWTALRREARAAAKAEQKALAELEAKEGATR